MSRLSGFLRGLEISSLLTATPRMGNGFAFLLVSFEVQKLLELKEKFELLVGNRTSQSMRLISHNGVLINADSNVVFDAAFDVLFDAAFDVLFDAAFDVQIDAVCIILSFWHHLQLDLGVEFSHFIQMISSSLSALLKRSNTLQKGLTLQPPGVPFQEQGVGLLLPLVAFLLELGRFDPDVHQLDAHRFLANLLTNFLTDWLRDNLNELLRDWLREWLNDWLREWLNDLLRDFLKELLRLTLREDLEVQIIQTLNIYVDTITFKTLTQIVN